MKTTRNSILRKLWIVLGVLVLALAIAPSTAQAAPFQLIYNGVFNTQDALNLSSQSAPSYFTTPTPFTISAFFDTSSPNLAPPSPPTPPPFAGFRAYSPSLATITIGGKVYTLDTFATNPMAGITVAIFDQNSFTPGRYGIGILQQPPEDGAGIIGDFMGASPNFTAGAITGTVFTGYAGVGYGSGVCLNGTGGDCALNAITPLLLRDSTNKVYALTLGNYDEDYPAGPLNTAVIVALPEPGTYTLGGLCVFGLLGIARRRRVN